MSTFSGGLPTLFTQTLYQRIGGSPISPRDLLHGSHSIDTADTPGPFIDTFGAFLTRGSSRIEYNPSVMKFLKYGLMAPHKLIPEEEIN
jgi:hypothetical protein